MNTTHPDSSAGKGKRWTREALRGLTPEQFAEHEDEIMAQLQAGEIKRKENR